MNVRLRSDRDITHLPLEAMKSQGLVMVACNEQDAPVGHLTASVSGKTAVIDRVLVARWASLQDAILSQPAGQMKVADKLLTTFVQANAGRPIKLGTADVSPKVVPLLESLGFTNQASVWTRLPTRKLTGRTASASPFSVFAAEQKSGFVTDIEKDTTENTDFRRVLYTGEHLQLVLMSLEAQEDIGSETHPDTDQFFRVDGGSGMVTIGGKDHPIKNGSAFVIPAGTEHNVTAGDEGLKVYSLYGPPNHADGTINFTRYDAEKSVEKYNGITTE